MEALVSYPLFSWSWFQVRKPTKQTPLMSDAFISVRLKWPLLFVVKCISNATFDHAEKQNNERRLRGSPP